MKKVGVTGGIGSGKSLVCKIFRCLNVPVFYADDEAGILLETDLEIRLTLTGIFSKELYLSGKLNKQMLADLIFSDKKNMDIVNNAIHPAVLKRFTEWCACQTKAAYVIMEAGISKDKVIERVNNQLTENERKEKADINLVNDGRMMLLPQILEVHKLLSGNV